MDVPSVSQCSGVHDEVHRSVVDLLLKGVNLGEWSFQELQDELFGLFDLAVYYTDELDMLKLMQLVRDTLIHFGDGYARGDVTLITLANVVHCLFTDVLSAFTEEDLVSFGLIGENRIGCPVVGAMNTILLQMKQYLNHMPFLRNIIFSFAECKFASEFPGAVTMLNNLSHLVDHLLLRRYQKMTDVFQLESPQPSTSL